HPVPRLRETMQGGLQRRRELAVHGVTVGDESLVGHVPARARSASIAAAQAPLDSPSPDRFNPPHAAPRDVRARRARPGRLLRHGQGPERTHGRDRAGVVRVSNGRARHAAEAGAREAPAETKAHRGHAQRQALLLVLRSGRVRLRVRRRRGGVSSLRHARPGARQHQEQPRRREFAADRGVRGGIAARRVVLAGSAAGVLPAVNLSYSADEDRFRAELRAWLSANPPGPEPEQLDAWVAYGKTWQRRLWESGWCGIAWP